MQKRVLAILLSSAGLWPALACALGLGDIEVRSALNQPLAAEIALTSVRPGETDGMLVTLASEDAFQQAGVERPFYLTKLKFSVETRNDGSQYVKVTTENPVREPFLSFLVDVDWPRGRLVREYTILLDPPVFATHNQTAAQPEAPEMATGPVSAAGTQGLIQRDSGAEETVSDDDFVFEDEVPADAGAAAPLADDWETGGATSGSPAELPDIEITAAPGVASPGGANDGAVALSPGEEYAAEEQPLESGEPAAEEEEHDFVDASEDWLQEDNTAAGKTPQQPVETAPEPAPDFGMESEPEEPSIESGIAMQGMPALPDISLEYDPSQPYDEAATNALLAQFAAEDEARSRQRPATAEKVDEHGVAAGDTLYDIANKYKAPDVTVNQAMLAILRYNPDAFIRDNINNVRKGFVLRIPDRDSMLQIDSREALIEVRRQNALWQEYRSQLAGAPSTVREAQKADDLLISERETNRSGGSGELTILSPGRDAQATRRASGAQEGSDSGSSAYIDLQLAKEQLQAVELEKKELQERLTQLTGQIAKQERIINLQNDQLAKLQQQLAESEKRAAGAKPGGTTESPGLGLKLQGEESAAPKPVQPELTTPSFDEPAQPQVSGSETAETSGQGEMPAASGTETQVAEAGEQAAHEEPTIAHDDLSFENELGKEPPLSLVPDNENSEGATEASDAESMQGTEESEADAGNAAEGEMAAGDETAGKTDAQRKPEPEIEVPPPPVRRKPTGLAGLAYDYVPSPYNLLLANALDSTIGQAIFGAVAILILLILWAMVKPQAGKAGKASKPSGVIAAATPADQLEKTQKSVSKKASIGERLSAMFAPITNVFGKRSKADLGGRGAARAAAFDAVEDSDAVSEEDDAVIEDLGEIESFDGPAEAAAAEEEEVEESSAFDKTTITTAAPPVQKPEEEVSDDTTQEADVYLAYGLHDQAEELLTQAIAANPRKIEYKGKLLETYFAAGKKAEFEKLAADVRAQLSGRSSRVWDKTVAMGKEIAPNNPLFSAADSGLKVEDFAPAKPETADLDLSEATGSTTPDIDFGEGEEASTTTDFDLDLGGGDDDETLIVDRSPNSDRTEIMELDAIRPDEEESEDGLDTHLEFDLKPDSDDVASDLNIDFNADELGLDTEVDLDTGFNSGSSAGGQNSTDDEVAIDMSFDLEDEAGGGPGLGSDDEADAIELDVDDDISALGNVDVDVTDFDVGSASAGDDLIADLEIGDEDLEIGGDDLPQASTDTEFEIPEDDDTIIDADLDDETISGDSPSDEVATKLDLAKAYMDMGDYDGASSTLEEVMAEGSDSQRREAEELLDQIN